LLGFTSAGNAFLPYFSKYIRHEANSSPCTADQCLLHSPHVHSTLIHINGDAKYTGKIAERELPRGLRD